MQKKIFLLNTIIFIFSFNAYTQNRKDSIAIKLKNIINKIIETDETPYSIIQVLQAENDAKLLVPLLKQYDTIENPNVQQKTFECYYIYGIKSSDPLFRQEMVLNLLSGCSSDTITKSYSCGTILDYLKEFNVKDFNEKAKNLIRKKLIKTNYKNEFILLAGMLYLRDMIVGIKNIFSKDKSSIIPYVALARMGDNEAINYLYNYFQKMKIADRMFKYNAYISYIKQPKILRIVSDDLFSEETYNYVKDGSQVVIKVKYNKYALFILSQVIKNFPVKPNYAKSYNDSELNIAREWIKKNSNNLIINRDVY